MKPWNLVLRFLLELAALAGLGVAAWHLTGGGVLGILAAALAVIAAATVWGVFAVPDDPSRNGKAPVPVPGWLRLLIELLIFAGGAAGFALAGAPLVALILGGLIVVHLVFSGQRLSWLVRQR